MIVSAELSSLVESFIAVDERDHADSVAELFTEVALPPGASRQVLPTTRGAGPGLRPK